MNNILNSGDIPNIYKVEDYEEIKKAVQQEMKSMAKIHITLDMMSPLGEKSVIRLRMFPSFDKLLNCLLV